MDRPAFRNKLLRRLDPPAFEQLGPHLERVELKVRDVIVRPNVTITHVSPANEPTNARTRRVRSAAASAAPRSVCAWSIGSVLIPTARFVIALMAATRIPAWRATITSGTVDIPTASAPRTL